MNFVRAVLIVTSFATVGGCTSQRAAPAAPRTPPTTPPAMSVPPALPDSAGFGVHVLAVARRPAGVTWVGTYGNGIYLMRTGAKDWEHIAAKQGDSTAIAWNFVNAFAFPADSSVWYGSVGNGFGRSTDKGRTWTNWNLSRLGPQWQYTVPEGMRTRGDTVYIATTDGLRVTWDAGASWRCVQSTAEAASTARDGCTERIAALPSKYLLALDVGPDGSVWVGHLAGLSVSRNAGRTWKNIDSPAQLRTRIRAIAVAQPRAAQEQMVAMPGEPTTGGGQAGGMGAAAGVGGNRQQPQRRPGRERPEQPDSTVWIATETDIYRGHYTREGFEKYTVDVPGWPTLPGAPRTIMLPPFTRMPVIGLSRGVIATDFDSVYHVYLGSGEQYRPAADIWSGAFIFGRLLPIVGTTAGLDRVLPIQKRTWDLINPRPAAAPAEAQHTWFRRPILDTEGNPHIDATYRYGSTMGGNFQQHQGIEFNNPAGTPVRAVDAGVVVFSGKAEAGSNTVAIRHERKWQENNVYSVYFHNSSLDVRAGQRVQAGDIIARVGNTGRATNDHLHLEVHVTPETDSAKIVDPAVRFPPFTVNPQLWLQPLPGTGIVAGQVFDAQGAAISGARIYGLVLPYPEETPFSFAETYADRAHPDPAYREHFAVGDVPEGRYLIGVDIAGQKVWRTVQVQAGRVSWVEFRP
jgi:hypothetical protein